MPLEKSIAIVLAGLSLAAHGAESEAKKPPPRHQSAQPDVNFLEYLGSLEGDDDNWTDIAKSVAMKSETASDSQQVETRRATGKVPAEAAAKRAENEQ